MRLSPIPLPPQKTHTHIHTLIMHWKAGRWPYFVPNIQYGWKCYLYPCKEILRVSGTDCYNVQCGNKMIFASFHPNGQPRHWLQALQIWSWRRPGESWEPLRRGSFQTPPQPTLSSAPLDFNPIFSQTLWEPPHPPPLSLELTVGRPLQSNVYT